MLQTHINNLWKAFNNKLEKDWEDKYADFGSLDKIIQRTNLAKAIENDMYKTLKVSRKEKGVVPNWNSINTYLKQKGFGDNPKPKTLDVIAEYLKYGHFDRFKKEYKPKLNQSITTQLTKTINESPKNDILRRNWKVFIILLLAPIIIYFANSFIKKYKLANNHDDKLLIISTIEKGNLLEYNIYASVPNIKDTIKLNKYFTRNGKARENILDVSKRGIQRGRKLDAKESSRTLDTEDIKVVELNKNTAKAETIEYWKLVWIFEKNGKIDAEYDEVNKQTYHLKKINDSWLIDKNDFTGTAEIHTEEDKK